MSFAPVISPTGIIAPTFADIREALAELMRSIYGSDIYLASDSQDGQFISALATLFHDQNDAIIAAYNAFSPLTAQGVGLSTVIKINGIRRLVASNSQVVVTIVGTVGTQINFGQVEDTAGNRWALPDLVTIPGGGTIDVTATALTVGAIQASPGTVTKISTPTRGWQTVTNAGAATPGEPVEPDATLRQRQSFSTAIPALSVLNATLGGIKSLVGVGRATIYENDTGTTDANGVPAHSISAVVEGGDVTTIAQTIAKYKTPGTGTHGDEAITVEDDAGLFITIHFYLLALVTVKTLVVATALTGFVSSTEDLIAASIAEWLNAMSIGQDPAISKLWSPVNLTGDAATVATGFSQGTLDPLSATYNATAIYQARADNMTLTAPTAAASNAFHLTDVTNYAVGDKVAVELDDGTYLKTTVTNITLLVVSTAANVPGGKTALAGSILYVSGDLVIDFNEAAVAEADDSTVLVT